MLRFINSAIDAAVFLGCIFLAAEVIKQSNIGRVFSKNANLIGFLLSLALGSLIVRPVSYGISNVLAFLTRYSGENVLPTIGEMIIGIAFLAGLLMIYNNWKKKM